MRRLFTFGCSNTKYVWPTWANIVGLNYDSHLNFGKPGAGNYYIQCRLNEVNQFYGITKDDCVMVMVSSFSRHDFIDNDSNWRCHGNIYTNDVFDFNFIDKYWSLEYGLTVTWNAVENIIKTLNEIGCEYKIMKSFDLSMVEVSPPTVNDKLNDVRKISSKVKYIERRLNEILPYENLFDFSQNKYGNFSKTNMYDFDDYPYKDNHPTIDGHLQWVKIYMPEYYRPEMDSMVRNWETLISKNRKSTADNFVHIDDEFDIFNPPSPK